MSSPFFRTDLCTPSILDKILNRLPKQNSFVELNNLLSSDVANINVHNVSAIENKYKVSFVKQFKKQLVLAYIRCWEDSISNLDFSYLRALKQVFVLDTETIDQDFLCKLFEKRYSLIEKDLKLPEEIDLCLPFPEHLVSTLSERIKSEKISKALQKVLDSLIADSRYSYEDEQELKRVCLALNATPSFNQETTDVLSKLRHYWELETQDLPIIETNINLSKNEVCFLHYDDVDLLELRKTVQSVDYHGPVVRIRICKGVYYRAGKVYPQVNSTTNLKLIDSGSLYLTNKRIIFMGEQKNKTLYLNKVLGFSPYSDGIEIEKETGINPVFRTNQNVNNLSIILSRMLQQ